MGIRNDLTAKIIDGKLIISTKTGNSTQRDTFINENDLITSSLNQGNTTTIPVVNSPEFEALKTELKGTWKYSEYTINDSPVTLSDCNLDSSISFSGENNDLLLTEKNPTFTNAQLSKYTNTGIVTSINGKFSFKTTKEITENNGKTKVIFDTDAGCPFIKEQTRIIRYKSTNEAHLGVSSNLAIIKLVDDTTLTLTITNNETDTIIVITCKKQ